MTTHRCHVPGATGSRVTLPEAEAHHVRHVLRLQSGDAVHVFDGEGREWRARVGPLGRRDVDVDLLDAITPVAEPPVVVTLAVGLLKGDQMRTVVRDATALGVARIVPLASSHVAVPSAARHGAFVERLTRIAVSSAAQCGRAVVPRVAAVARFEDVIADPAAGRRIISVEPVFGREETPWADPGGRPDLATVFIGPEGGWSPAEVAHAIESGAVPLSLGPRTLRAEMAPTVALSVLWARWGWT